MHDRLQAIMPKPVLGSSFLLIMFFVYGCIAFNGYLSMTASKKLPCCSFMVFRNHRKLWGLLPGSLHVCRRVLRSRHPAAHSVKGADSP